MDPTVVSEMIEVLADALRRFRAEWLEQHWVPPALRELLQ